MRVIVCGGRDYADREKVFSVLDEIATGKVLTVIHGGATGADTLAYEWWRTRHAVGECIRVSADWKRFGRMAGPLRNERMLNMAPDLVVAFPGGRGTADMVRRAKLVGVPVHEVQ